MCLPSAHCGFGWQLIVCFWTFVVLHLSTVQLRVMSPFFVDVGTHAGETKGLDEHVANLDQRSYEGQHAPCFILAARITVKHIIIVTAGLEGAILGGGMGTAYSAMARHLAACGHIVRILYVPLVLHHSGSPPNHTHLSDFYSFSSTPFSIFIESLVVTLNSCTISQIFPSQDTEGIPLRGINQSVCSLTRKYSHARIRSFLVYRWLRAFLQELSERETNHDVIVHIQDNAGLGFYTSEQHSRQLLPIPITLVLGAHAPHLWERLANASPELDKEDAELDAMERVTATNVDWLISPSRYLLRWMLYQGWEFPSKVAVQLNMVPQPVSVQPSKQHAPLNAELWFPLTEIVFFGRLELRKGVFIFLDAAGLLVNNIERGDFLPSGGVNRRTLTLSFLGSDTQDAQSDNGWVTHRILRRCHVLRDRLRERMNGNGDLNCTFLTNLTRQIALQYLARYPLSPPLAVISSPIDNSPYTIAESLSLGAPFLATAVGGIPELLYRYLQPHVAQSHMFVPTARHLADKLQKATITGVRWAPGVNEDESHIIWQRWHDSLPPAVYSPASVAVSSAGAARTLLVVSVIYAGDIGALCLRINAVFHQHGIDVYELRLIIVRLVLEGSDEVEEGWRRSSCLDLVAAGSDGQWSLRFMAASFADLVGYRYWQWMRLSTISQFSLLLNRSDRPHLNTSIASLMKAALHTQVDVIAALVHDPPTDSIVDLGCQQVVVPSASSVCFEHRSVLIGQLAKPLSSYWISQKRKDASTGSLSSSYLIPEPLFAAYTA